MLLPMTTSVRVVLRKSTELRGACPGLDVAYAGGTDPSTLSDRIMWHGTYRRWMPVSDWSSCRVDIEGVHDDWEGFRIWLRHHDPTRGMLIVRFGSALLYDSAAESDRIGETQQEQPELEFPHVFWTVENSELLSLFHRQSCGIHADEPLVHFSFLACNQCIDVISREPPTFSGNGG